MGRRTLRRTVGIVSVAGACALLATVATTLAFRGGDTGSAPVRNLYVSPQGSDSNPGSLAAPLRTLQRAQIVARRLAGRAPGDVAVNLQGGVYRLRTPLVFGPQDSGRNGHRVIWRAMAGAHPVLSGGTRIRGWSRWRRGIWRARIPRGVRSRQLYVNGRPAVLARESVDASRYHITPWGLRTTDPAIRSTTDPTDVDVVLIHAWKDQRCRVAGVAASKVTMEQPCWTNTQLQGPDFDAVSWLENSLRFLDQPGEFSSDPAEGWVYYEPRPGEHLGTSDVEYPGLESLLLLRGSSTKPVHDLVFSGVRFADATWLGPESHAGYALGQAGVRLVGTVHVHDVNGYPTAYYVGRQLLGELMPAAVDVEGGRRIAFLRDDFFDLGAAGLAIGAASHDDLVARSRFHEISGNGIEIGGVTEQAAHPAHLADATSRTTVRNCRVEDVETEFLDATGILVGYASHVVVSHNELADLPATAISVGWGWGITDPEASGGDPRHAGVYSYLPRYSKPTVSSDNEIVGNRIIDVGSRMSDGGAIYTLGAQRGTRVLDNYVDGVHGGSPSFTGVDNPPAALYPDEGSRYMVWKDNVATDITMWVRLWNTFSIRDNTVADNFHDPAMARLQAARYNSVTGNVTVPAGRLPPRARAIKRASGPRPRST